MDCNYNISGHLKCKEHYSQIDRIDIYDVCKKINNLSNKNIDLIECKEILLSKVIDKCRICLQYDFDSNECKESLSGLVKDNENLPCKEALKMVGFNSKKEVYNKLINFNNSLKKTNTDNPSICSLERESIMNPCYRNCKDPFENLDCLFLTEIYCNMVLNDKSNYKDYKMCNLLLKEKNEKKDQLIKEYYLKNPTTIPTESPTVIPTTMPSESPTVIPTHMPTESPTVIPTHMPTEYPTVIPTHMPTESPTVIPTYMPTESPTVIPTHMPTVMPTHMPTVMPTHMPIEYPTVMPTESPTSIPKKVNNNTSEKPINNLTSNPKLVNLLNWFL